MIIKSHIHQLLPNYDQFEGVFTSVIYLIRTLFEKGPDPANVKEQVLITHCESTSRLLSDAVSLMCSGRDKILVNLVMDLEYNKQFFKPGITEKEINELLLTKALISLFLNREYDSIYYIISFLCSGSVQQKLLQSYPLTELNNAKGE